MLGDATLSVDFSGLVAPARAARRTTSFPLLARAPLHFENLERKLDLPARKSSAALAP